MFHSKTAAIGMLLMMKPVQRDREEEAEAIERPRAGGRTGVSEVWRTRGTCLRAPFRFASCEGWRFSVWVVDEEVFA